MRSCRNGIKDLQLAMADRARPKVRTRTESPDVAGCRFVCRMCEATSGMQNPTYCLDPNGFCDGCGIGLVPTDSARDSTLGRSHPSPAQASHGCMCQV